MAGSPMSLRSVNPADGQLLQEYSEPDAKAVAGILREAHAAFLGWRRTSFAERAAPMRAPPRCCASARRTWHG